MENNNDLLYNLLEGNIAQPEIMLLESDSYMPGYKFKYHSYTDSIEVVLVTYGSSYIAVEDCHIKLRKGECLVILPGLVHNFYLREHESCRLINLVFDPYGQGKGDFYKRVEQLLPLFFELGRKERSFIKFTDDGTVRVILERLMSLRKRKSRFQRELLKMCFCEFYIELSASIEEAVKNNTASQNIHINKALNYITRSIGEKITLEAAAHYAGISSKQLTKLFIREFGMSLPDYVKSYRIGKARELLENTAVPVTEIAYKLGFSSSQYLTTCFKKLMGFTPRYYRDKFRSSN